MIALVHSAVYFSVPGELLRYGADNFTRMFILALIFLLIALLVGVLQDRAQQALLRERRKNDELSVLRAALDQSEVGVVLLDNELGARFINRAYRNLWQLSDKVADSKPSFISLLYHARDAQAYDVSADQMEEYIAGRVASVQMGMNVPWT